jgi:hypothetical protein
VFGEDDVEAKYAAGAKVRINAHDARGRVFDSQVALYQNMIGEILSSMAVVGFTIPQARSNEMPAGESYARTLYYYTVLLDNGTTLQYVIEDCLELLS